MDWRTLTEPYVEILGRRSEGTDVAVGARVHDNVTIPLNPRTTYIVIGHYQQQASGPSSANKSVRGA